MTSCNSCRKEVTETEIYTFNSQRMCEDCAMHAGLIPLGHTGLRRDKISEEGRHLTMPERDET